KRISTAGGTYPLWGAGGRELFYVSASNKVMAVSMKPVGDTIEPAAPRELFALPLLLPGASVSPYDTTRDGQRFLVLTGDEHATQPLTVIVNSPAPLKKGIPTPGNISGSPSHGPLRTDADSMDRGEVRHDSPPRVAKCLPMFHPRKPRWGP